MSKKYEHFSITDKLKLKTLKIDISNLYFLNYILGKK